MGRRMVLVSILIFPLFALSCEKTPGRFPVFSGRAGQVPAIRADPTRHRDRDDAELARIAQNARDTLPVFFRRFQSPRPGDGNFRIKCPLRADARSGFSREQVWLADIRFRDGGYSGILVNTPYYVSGLARGERTGFSIDEITDWMFTSEGRITGGLSIKYLLEQIPEHERDEEQRLILDMFR
jgi:uncharacterized protein YegJ (DUF2314 family)